MTDENRPGGENHYSLSLDHAPLPTERTLRRRRSPVFQAGRFIFTNLRLARMIFGGRH